MLYMYTVMYNVKYTKIQCVVLQYILVDKNLWQVFPLLSCLVGIKGIQEHDDCPPWIRDSASGDCTARLDTVHMYILDERSVFFMSILIVFLLICIYVYSFTWFIYMYVPNVWLHV